MLINKLKFHFANIIDESIEEILIIAGFGTLDNHELVTEKADEEAVVTERVDKSSKKFFHLTLDEAVATATNTPL